MNEQNQLNTWKVNSWDMSQINTCIACMKAHEVKAPAHAMVNATKVCLETLRAGKCRLEVPQLEASVPASAPQDSDLHSGGVAELVRQ